MVMYPMGDEGAQLVKGSGCTQGVGYRVTGELQAVRECIVCIQGEGKAGRVDGDIQQVL